MSLLIDRLTDGPSELHFQQLFEQHLQQGPLPCALLYVNIKRFHSINAIYGREIGDWVLQTVYHIFAGLLHEHERLSRIHTDTFLLLLTAGTRAELEERILQFDDAVYSHQELQRVHRIFFSMGTYLIEGRTDTYAHAVDCANYSRISSSDCADEIPPMRSTAIRSWIPGPVPLRSCKSAAPLLSGIISRCIFNQNTSWKRNRWPAQRPWSAGMTRTRA